MPSLRTLAPGFRDIAVAFYAEVRRRWPGAGFTITSAKRSRREQQRLFDEFLAGRNDGLPASPPGRSDHETGRAFDMARVNRDPLNDVLLEDAGRLWESMGGVWGGRWSSRDPVHFAAGRGWSAQRRRTRRARSSRR